MGQAFPKCSHTGIARTRCRREPSRTPGTLLKFSNVCDDALIEVVEVIAVENPLCNRRLQAFPTFRTFIGCPLRMYLRFLRHSIGRDHLALGLKLRMNFARPSAYVACATCVDIGGYRRRAELPKNVGQHSGTSAALTGGRGNRELSWVGAEKQSLRRTDDVNYD